MINLLPPEKQKHAYREYQMRIATIAFALLGVLGLIFGGAMIPIYFRLETDTDLVTADLEAKKGQISTKDQSFENDARRLMAQVRTLEDGPATTTPPDVLIRKVIGLKNSAVALVGFTYDHTDVATTLQIQGMAGAREDLLAFRTALESDPLFVSVELPAETIIKKANIPFSIRLSLAGGKARAATPDPGSGSQGAELLP